MRTNGITSERANTMSACRGGKRRNLLCVSPSRASVGIRLDECIAFVWPPSAIAVAALLQCGLRAWPGVFIGVTVLTWSIISSGTEANAREGFSFTVESIKQRIQERMSWYEQTLRSGQGLLEASESVERHEQA